MDMAETACKRVLVVDDASLVRLYYRGALEGCGFEVEEALNGLEGLEKVLAAPFGLLVVDVNMPQMDGFTFVESVRNLPLPLGATPVLITSTESGPQDFAAARKAGANFYLTKPVTPEQLAEYALMLCGASA
jgi:two-component system, chemotaxis family, chemotaxis protein CheY